MSKRRTEYGFTKLLSELASAPLCTEEAFEYAIGDLASLGAKSEQFPIHSTRQTPNRTETARLHSFWEAVEGKLLKEHPGVSVDEFTALRDWIWLTDEAKATSRPVRIREYLRALATKLLVDEGAVLLPSVRQQGILSEIAGDNVSRFGRKCFTWLKRSLPTDLLAISTGNPRVRPVEHMNLATRRQLEKGFAEIHLHLGASFTFTQLWPCLLGRLADQDFAFDEFNSPNAVFDHGRGLATWLVRAAICRVHLARFLFLKHPFDSFGNYIRGAAENVRNSKHLIHTFDEISSPNLRHANYNQSGFASLQDLYRSSAFFKRAPVSDLNSLLEADPIYQLTHLVDPGSTTSEEIFLARGLRYLSRVEDDSEFERMFWQVQRVRCILYRYITQQHSVPGLVWFTRFYRRISPARKGQISTSGKICVAAETAGIANGLQSLEVRVSPGSNSQEILTEVKELAETSEAINQLATEKQTNLTLQGLDLGGQIKFNRQRAISLPHNHFLDRSRLPPRNSVTQSDVQFELGLVLHFVKERERESQEHLSPFGQSSHENPELSATHRYRYRDYFVSLQRQTDAIVRVLRQYPLSLQWIRGIDVCNDERAMPTWLFSAHFKRIINASRETSAELSRNYGIVASPIRATSHAGEDFVHLLTGMRRIDEALEILCITEEGRIGHGLALGTDPMQWATDIESIAIDKLTRLHDLVWEWSVLKQMPESGSYARGHFLEANAQCLIDDIFSHWGNKGDTKEFSQKGEIPNLNDLVILRRNLADPQCLAEVGYPDGIPGQTSFVVSKLDKHLRILYHYLTDPVLFRKGRDVILVSTQSTGPVLTAVQDYLRRKIANRRVLIEVNPSSNEVVGGYSSLESHPMWRLTSPSYSSEIPEISVCVGSDDPLIFATSLPQEYQRLIDSLSATKKYSDRAIRTWIDSVRENSLASRVTLPRVSFFPVTSIFQPDARSA